MGYPPLRIRQDKDGAQLIPRRPLMEVRFQLY